MQIEGLNWYCLCVVPQKEFLAEYILQQIGIAPSVFVPSEYKHPRRHRKRARPDYRERGKRYPMFGARYVFVGVEGQLPYYRLMGIHLVTGIVLERQGAVFRPAKFPTEDIENVVGLCESAKSGMLMVRGNTPNPHQSYQAGEYVDVLSGPFEGYHLRIKAVRGHFAQFALRIFGKRQLIELSLDRISAC